MTWEIWLLYATTVLAFMITPGPSHLLMLSNSMIHGFKPSLATAAGDLTANALQMLAAGLGLAAILLASQNAFLVVKWLGVLYLLWMGLRMWRDADKSASKLAGSVSPSIKKLWLQGFLTSAANPKAVVFFAALFPQFINPNAPFAFQFFVLSITYIAIDGFFLTSYGASAGWIARRLAGAAKITIHRAGGMFLIIAAFLLGLKTVGETR